MNEERVIKKSKLRYEIKALEMCLKNSTNRSPQDINYLKEVIKGHKAVLAIAVE